MLVYRLSQKHCNGSDDELICFSLLVKFPVSNGRHGEEETCEELVREVEGNGVFSQLSLEVSRKLSKLFGVTKDAQLLYTIVGD